MKNEQMELSLNSEKAAVRNCRRERRITRATWWFSHMRQIVERATEWPTAPEPRPEQIWMPGTQRQVQL